MSDPLYQVDPPRRPGVVTVIGVVLYLQALLAAVAGLVLLVWRDEVLEHLDREGSPSSEAELAATTVGEFVAAVLLVIVASGLMRGSSSLRILVMVVQVATMGLAVYTVVVHTTDTYVLRAVVTLGVGTFVLWALYGNDESDRFFRSTP